MKLRVICLGAGGSSGLSGIHNYLFSKVAEKNDLIEIKDTKLHGFWKYWNILYCFFRMPGYSKYIHPFHTVSGNEISYYRQRTKYYLLKRTEACEKELSKLFSDYDIIFQTSWQPAIRSKPGKPHCIYVDFTMKMAENLYPAYSKFLTETEKTLWNKLEKETFFNASHVFTFSSQTERSIIEDYGVNPEKVSTALVGVNLTKIPVYEKCYDNKFLLFVSGENTFELKGGNTLLKAFKEVQRRIPDAKLHIVGTNINHHIYNLTTEGYIKHYQLLKYYEKASIVVMPTIMGGYQTILEGMAYKCPCIGGITCSDIIMDGRTGFIVKPNDDKRLAEKIILLLENVNMMKKFGDDGQKHVENYFTWDKVVEHMNQVFDKL